MLWRCASTSSSPVSGGEPLTPNEEIGTSRWATDPAPPANKQVIVDALLAAKSMPKSPKWVDINKVVVEVFAGLREGKVSVNAGLADIDRRVAAILNQK